VNDYIKAWQCIGCGKIEAPQTCIGVCQDRKVELVYAFEHAQALAALSDITLQRDRLSTLLRRFVSITPRTGEWERALRRFQHEARELLVQLRDGATSETPRAATNATAR